jgi:glutamate dehydrogenase
MTSPQHMLWMLDEFEHIRGGHFPASSPASRWAWAARWAAPRPPATASSSPARGAARARTIRPRPIPGQRAGLRQRGPVRHRALPSSAARSPASPAGTRPDQTSYAFRKTDGIDRRAAGHHRPLRRYRQGEGQRTLGYEVLPGDDWIDQEVDILIPAALENQISDGRTSKRIAPQVKAHRRGRQRVRPTPRPTRCSRSAASS